MTKKEAGPLVVLRFAGGECPKLKKGECYRDGTGLWHFRTPDGFRFARWEGEVKSVSGEVTLLSRPRWMSNATTLAACHWWVEGGVWKKTQPP